jgi:hypothetical protein
MRSSFMRRCLAAGAACTGGLLFAATPAHAALTSPIATAYVVSADAIGTLVAVPAQPESTYPPGGTATLASLHLGSVAGDTLMTATTSGNDAAGTSSASATTDAVTLNLGGLATVTLDGINANCSAGPDGPTGVGTVTSGSYTIAGITTPLNITGAKNQVVGIGAVATLTLNQQSTDTNNVLTVESAHIQLVGGTAANIIVGYAQCGGSPATEPVPMVSPEVGGGTAAAAAVGGVVYRRRRQRGVETEAI